MLVGRREEIQSLNEAFQGNSSEFIALFGRRRVVISRVVWYYNNGLGDSPLDHRRREEFPVIFFGDFHERIKCFYR